MTAKFDFHAHLDDERLKSIGITKIINRAIKAGVDLIISNTINLKSFKENLQLSQDFPNLVKSTIGLQPLQINQDSKIDIEKIEKIVESGEFKPIAIGEIGLDFYYQDKNKKDQIEIFERQLNLAEKFNLTAIIHVRQSAAETLAIIKNHPNLKFVCHSFAENYVWAKNFLDRGGWLSFSAMITYPKNEELRQTIKKLPLDRILIESDSPALPPQSKRGQINEPSFIEETAARLSQVLNLDQNQLWLKLRQNLNQVLA